MKRLLLAVGCWLSAPAFADEREAFHAAASLIGVDDARASEAFERLAADHPDDEYAADALMEAAQLNEEKLAHPDRAADLYARLVERYPSNRLSLRARARRDFLRRSLSTGAAPLAEYQDILLRYGTRAPSESAARMEKLLAAHPDFALAEQARLWLARAALRERRFDEAARRFAEVAARAPSSEAGREARKGMADAALAAGHRREARRLYLALAADVDRATAEAGRLGAREAERALVAYGFFVAALAYLALFLAACAWQARRRLAHAPFELKFYLPVAALFVLAAATENRAIGVATAAIAAGGALVVWFGGAATAARLARGPLPVVARLLRAAATALAVGAVAFATVHATSLADLVVETMRNGPDK